MSGSELEFLSPWFVWHAGLFRPGVSVLDLACGRGRHAIAAAQRGAEVTAVDQNPDRLTVAARAASAAAVPVEWVRLDLERDPMPSGPFDVVMVFNYLDRDRLPDMLRAVRPGGHFLFETFLEQQRDLGMGPTSDNHLLKCGELFTLLQPFEIVFAREVLEVLDGQPWAVASALAQRPAV